MNIAMKEQRRIMMQLKRSHYINSYIVTKDYKIHHPPWDMYYFVICHKFVPGKFCSYTQ